LAILDKANNKIVIRLVYDGAPLSGKTTSLRALSQSFAQELYTPEEVYGRTTFFDWMQYTGGLFEGYQIRCQLVSVPGQIVWARRRQQLLQSADAIVFVGETSREKFDETLSVLQGLQNFLQDQPHPPGIIFQANKRDLPGALPLTEIQSRLAVVSPNAQLVESIATESTGTRYAFVMAVRVALDHVRELIKAAVLPEGKPEIESGEALLHAILESEAGATPLEIEDLLDNQLTAHIQPRRESQGASTPAPAETADIEYLSLQETANETHEAVALETSNTHESVTVETEENEVLEVCLRMPQLPTADVADGSIWPPIQGRVTVKEMTATGPVLRRLENGDWAIQPESDWLVYSYQEDGFLQLTDARQHLIRWAHIHIANNVMVSPGRCLVLTQHEDEGWRLWQIVRKHPTLADAINQALAEPDVERMAVKLRQCLNTLALAAQTFPDATSHLPLRLSTISCDEMLACYADILPRLTTATPPQQSSAFDLVLEVLESEIYPLLDSILADKPSLAAELARHLKSRRSFSLVTQITLDRVVEKLSPANLQVSVEEMASV
jgi:signal recognition particle receptor subunit beta